MSNLLKPTINAIYETDTDFLVLGLTGRTGSGCSTVAEILQSKQDRIRHSLYLGKNPDTNDQRKERIIYHFFTQAWIPFQLIQVRSIITLTMAQKGGKAVIEYMKNKLKDNSFEERKTKKPLNEIRRKYRSILKEDVLPKEIIEFYTNYLPSKCQEFRKNIGESLFVKLYQQIGKNIRMSGDPFDETQHDGCFFTLAERINDVVKAIKDANKNLNQSTLLVIDAIRNPFEALFFQDRYAAFYLVAVSCPDKERKDRLQRIGFSLSDIDIIDSEEYRPRNVREKESTYVQDIQSCLQRADIYVSNPNEVNRVSEFKTLANQLIKFVSLMRRPGLVTPSAVERCMQLAYAAKLNSGCISRQVGAAVTDENFSIKAIGWNDTPFGQVPCNLRSRDDLLEGNDPIAYSDFEKSDAQYIQHLRSNFNRYSPIRQSGRNLSYCFKGEYNELKAKQSGIEKRKFEQNQVHTRSLHAEENAFLQISKYGGAGIEGGCLFTTASPCELCSKKAYQLGITRIFYIDPYPGIAMTHIIKGGSRNPELILFSGAIGRAFHKLYTPTLPYKDELAALCEQQS